jgi:hypothetical protein
VIASQARRSLERGFGRQPLTRTFSAPTVVYQKGTYGNRKFSKTHKISIDLYKNYINHHLGL